MQRNTFPAAAIECRQAVGTNQLVDFGPTDVQGAGYLGNGEQENRESLLNRLLDSVGFFWHCSSLLNEETGYQRRFLFEEMSTGSSRKSVFEKARSPRARYR